MTTIRETTFNTKLTEILRGKNPRWRKDNAAVGEAGNVLQNSGTPDILIAPDGTMPIVVETEFLPALTVEEEAIGRIGCVVAATNTKIEQAVALRAPQKIKTAAAARLESEICNSQFEYCLFSAEGSDGQPIRWPNEGWLSGGVDELVALIENAGISEQLIAKSLEILEGAVAGAAASLLMHTNDKPAVKEKIAALLHQTHNEQTTRMAMAIIANALTFQEILAGEHGARSVRQLRIQLGRLPVGKVVSEWQRIVEEINYWPVFHIAREVVNEIPANIAAQILDRLATVVDELIALGITSSHDLYGRMFQRLITDRKFLATFYTLPESAMLLAEIAVDMLDIDYAAEDAAPNLRLADFACGTGTLLAAAYHAVLARHRRAGHDDAKIHKAMMEKSLIATDIMPAGVHLTVSILSSVHPTITFEDTKVHTLPYGTDGKQIRLGALDLVEKQASRDLFQTRTRIGGRGARKITAKKEQQEMFALEHESCDLVIMNPPFTRPTNHEVTDRPVPSFAGFSTSNEEQRAMATRLKKINARLPEHAGHGNAGLASNFIDLAHQKLKPGGVLAMVLPSTFAQGKAWGKSRNLVNKHYDNIFVISLATPGVVDRSFSADTGMAEILLIGKKRKTKRKQGSAEVRFASLRKRPVSAVQSAVVARAIRESRNGINVGAVTLGEVFNGTLRNGGTVGVLDTEVAEIAKELQAGALMLSGVEQKFPLPIARLGKIAERGLVDRDINGLNVDGSPRGPFDLERKRDQFPTYPCLQAHHNDVERCFILMPDTQGRVRKGMRTKANAVLQTATTLHFNRDFQINAQALVACVTPERTIGGTAWPNVRPLNPKHEPAIILWANSTLGLLLWWWVGSRQQKGRARITISGLQDLPILDTRKLSAKQHQQAARIFTRFKQKDFLAANEAYHCESRKALDRAVLVELLGLPETVLEPLDLLRYKWCNEPSVHGGKKTRPRVTQL